MQKKEKMFNSKKAVSPLISTVLLIMIVVILALIIIAWSGVFFGETIVKEIGGEQKSAEQRCSEITIQTFSNPDETFGFKNIGNVPIYALKIKLSKDGSSQTLSIDEPTGTVNPSFSITLTNPTSGANLLHSNYDEVKIIPIVLGTNTDGQIQEFQCPEATSFII